MGWIGCAIQQVTSKRLPRFFSYFQDIFWYNFIKKPQTRNARVFLPLNISAVGSVAFEGHHNRVITFIKSLLKFYLRQKISKYSLFLNFWFFSVVHLESEVKISWKRKNTIGILFPKLLWPNVRKNDLVIEKTFWDSRLHVENFNFS